MAHEDFWIKVGDRRPYLKGTLEDENGNEINITLADSVYFSMKTRDGGSPKIDRVEAEVVDPTNGIVQYKWAAGDTDTPGTYFGEFIVDWNGAGTDDLTCPNDGYIVIVIKDDVS